MTAITDWQPARVCCHSYTEMRTTWALLAYLAVLVTFVGFAVWFWGLRALPAARAGALMFLQPVSGLALASLVPGERLSPTFLLGCALVLAGVYLAVGRATSPA